MKKNEQNVKEKNKADMKKIFGKVMAFVLLTAMVFASCSTCIYYVIANVK